MESITSAAAFFRAAHNQRVIANVIGGYCYEDWDQQVAELKQQCEKNNAPASAISVSESKFTLQLDGQAPRTVFRPKLRRCRKGLMTVRSADYIFEAEGEKESSFGQKKGAYVENSKLVIVTLNGTKITYEIE
ncbi:hypothetical protein [Enterovibrio norvegicus]|uniref:hypothetical protein n=1 Tax=Enterovibrio norvegicus TaxID=188144 RepID=UPI00352D5C06